MLHRQKPLRLSNGNSNNNDNIKRAAVTAVATPADSATTAEPQTQEEAEEAFLESLDYKDDYVPVWSEYDSWGWDRRKKRGLGSMG